MLLVGLLVVAAATEGWDRGELIYSLTFLNQILACTDNNNINYVMVTPCMQEITTVHQHKV